MPKIKDNKKRYRLQFFSITKEVWQDSRNRGDGFIYTSKSKAEKDAVHFHNKSVFGLNYRVAEVKKAKANK